MATPRTTPAPRAATALYSPSNGVAPVVIEASGICKTFQIPEQRLDTIKERLTRPNARRASETLEALDDVSFEVFQGEFFGIVGRNGSGKSTLLKIISSIYSADSGRVRIAGQVAPFIELGVGFNPEFSARENIHLNGVLMGLSRREARRRLDEVLEFAELERFADLKVKNYSSGMMVRLAFSIMVQADAQILLIDEVLAVGDAAFAEKCMEVFRERRSAGTTIVLVTHDMTMVRLMCDRAMLLDRGRAVHVGNPEEVALGYDRLNDGSEGSTERSGPSSGHSGSIIMEEHVRVRSTAIEGAADKARSNLLEVGAPLVVSVLLEPVRDLADMKVRLQLRAQSGVVIVAIETESLGAVAAGREVTIAGTVDNQMVPGDYFLDCWVKDTLGSDCIALQAVRLASFRVVGPPAVEGFVVPRHSIVGSVAN